MISGALLFAIAISVPPEFRECVRQLRVEAKDAGIRGNTFDRAMKGVEPDQGVIDAMNTQPEIETPIWDYMDRLVSPQRIVDGQARIAQWSAVLDRAEQVYGVDRYTLVAVWGVESDYGRIMGQRPLMRSLATVSCYGERQKFFRGELFAAMNIVQAGDIKLETLRAPGPAPSATHSSSRRPSSASPWISTATASAISSTRCPTRWHRLGISSRRAAGGATSRGDTRCGFPRTTTAPRDATSASRLRNG